MPEEAPKRTRGVGWAVVFVIATIAMVYAFMQLQQVQSQRPTPASLKKFSAAPEFQLVTSNGERLSKEDFDGKVWVTNFIFTRCQGPCPVITGRMAELQEQLRKANASDVHLLTITVDPDYDTPEVLARYAEQVGADPEVWSFATGPKAHVEEVVKKGFLQPIVEAPDGEIIHTSRFVVTDRNGMMRSFPDGNDASSVQRVLLDIRDLLREQPAATQ